MSTVAAGVVAPPEWTSEELAAGRQMAIDAFRTQRMGEPLEAYLEVVDKYRGKVEELLEATIDLSRIREEATEILSDSELLEVFRYLAGPPISLDDLKVLADVKSISPKALRSNPDDVKRLVDTVWMGLDRRRFAWVAEDREPTEPERDAAVIASAAVMAVQRVATNRRTDSKIEQEHKVEEVLSRTGFELVDTRDIRNLRDAPEPGQFCKECPLGSRKADLVVGLWDGRVMGIECKVSNSETNSIKRLRNDAAAKAETWRVEFGERQVVPTAVLSGVYKLSHLENAQQRGLTLFWAHDLAAMATWIASTKI